MRLCGLYSYGRRYGAESEEDTAGHRDDDGHQSSLRVESKFLNFLDRAEFAVGADLAHATDGVKLTTDATLQRSRALCLLGINMAVNHSLQLRGLKEPAAATIAEYEDALVGSSQDEKVQRSTFCLG